MHVMRQLNPSLFPFIQVQPANVILRKLKLANGPLKLETIGKKRLKWQWFLFGKDGTSLRHGQPENYSALRVLWRQKLSSWLWLTLGRHLILDTYLS